MTAQTYALIATRKQTITYPDETSREFLKDEVINTLICDEADPYEPTAYQRLDRIEPGWGVVDGKLVQLPAPDEEAPPPPIRVIRALAFRDRFAAEKQSAISVAAMQSAAAGDGSLLTFMLNQAAAAQTDLDDPRVQAGVAALKAAELITEAEATAILADGTPDEAA